MERFLINPLSPVTQCVERQQFEALLSDITECFDYILPALDCGKTKLFYDPILDSQSFFAGESVIESISRLGGKRGPDLRKKWFLYTKNRSRKLPDDHCAVLLLSKDAGIDQSISGKFHKSFLIDDYSSLLSFGGHPILQSGLITVCSPPDTSFEKRNAWHADSVALLFPQYEPSQKHRMESYFDRERGEHVAPMQLNPSEAQILLIQSIKHEGDYWGFHRHRQSFYRFKLTGGNVYHGFEVNDYEVPSVVSAQLRDR